MSEKEQTKKQETPTDAEIDQQKRSFMKKFGQYAAVGAGVSVVMKPSDMLADSGLNSDNAP